MVGIRSNRFLHHNCNEKLNAKKERSELGDKNFERLADQIR